MEERNLSNILKNLSHHGRETAYVQHHGYRIERWSYQRVVEVSRQFARELMERNISRSDHVVIWGDNCAEWVAAFFGTVVVGAVVVPMDRTTSQDFVRKVCSQVAPRLIVRSRNISEAVGEVPVLFLEGLSETVAHHSKEPVSSIQVLPRDTAEIIFTSGTTAEPKGVVLSHENILANLEPLEIEIRKYLKYEKIIHPLRFLNLLPLSHTFGQYLGIFIPQILASTVVFQNSLKPSDIIRSLRRGRISVLVGVPRILESLKDALEREMESDGVHGLFQKRIEKARNSHFLKRWWLFRRVHRRFGWKFWAFICGGAKLRDETECFWTTLGFAVIQGYGLTETSSLISLNHPLKISGGSIGKILPGREIRVSESGEILVRGRSVAKSYFKDKLLIPVSNEDGWFPTGDVGTIDDDGNLYFKGRQKNVIVSSEGMNIYPEDIESELKNQAEVRDCVVMGLEAEGNSQVCAVLLLHEKEQHADIVVQRTNESLAAYQHIRNWFVWPEKDFPRTSTQKPKIGQIRQIVHSKFHGISEGSPGVGILADLIRQVTHGRIEEVGRDSNAFKELDLSSIERVELLGLLEDRFQVDLNEDSFSEARSLSEVEALLHQPALQRSDHAYPKWTQSNAATLLRKCLYCLIIWPLTCLMARPSVYGREHLKGLNGPVLFVSNHVTQVDVVFVLAALPTRLRHRLAVAMIGEMLKKFRQPDPDAAMLLRWISMAKYGLVTALFNVFPLPQKTGFRESFRFAGESADRGFSILVFPEGGRTPNGKMQCFQSGIGVLAKELSIPVVPMRIDGLYEIKKSGKRMACPGTVTVRIGTPVRYSYDMGSAAIAADLQSRVAGL